MSINVFSLNLLKSYMPFKRVLALGYLDVISPLEEIEEAFPDADLSNPVFNKESQKWHGLGFEPVDSRWLLARLGVEKLDVLDVEKWRGDEITGDLNEPMELEPYDLVIDHGTIEHCMNIGQALKNIAGFVKVGGYVFNGPPLNMYNHGFYNVCPTLFYDFYVRNGWRIEAMCAMTRTGWFEIPRTERFSCEQKEASIVCLAHRLTAAAPVWHMQTKYQKKIAKAA